MSWTLVFTKAARQDAKRLKAAGLQEKTQALLDIVGRNPLANPAPHEKLVGDLAGAYSRRINIQHRLVYQIVRDARTVKVLRMWTHYG
ncbi:MAG: Txe/YoeB family addiction module toxin [Rhodanobacteraceae bacterium]